MKMYIYHLTQKFISWLICNIHVHVTVNIYWLSDFTDVFYTAIDFCLTSRAVGVQIIHLADVEELVS